MFNSIIKIIKSMSDKEVRMLMTACVDEMSARNKTYRIIDLTDARLDK